MVTADVLAVVFTLLGLLLAVPAFVVVARALWPRLAAQSARRFALTPGRTVLTGFFVGLPVLVPPMLLMGVDLPPVHMLGVLWVGLALGLALAGAQGLAERIGTTLATPGDAHRPWAAVVKGTIALQLACLVPLLGWFLLFPLVLVAGAGAAVLSILRPLREPAPAPVPAIDGTHA